MTKTDLTDYSDSELYDHFQNVESLYKAFCSISDFDHIEALADELFEYTDEQLEELRSEHEEEHEEDEEEELGVSTIVDSYINGNKKQFVEYVNEYGPALFVQHLEQYCEMYGISKEIQCKILISYVTLNEGE